MATYVMEIKVEAEQFLPDEDKIPKGVTSDGPRSPKTDSRAAWILRTNEGASYPKSGDYIVTNPDGSKAIMPREVIEESGIYKLVEG